jgi:hypothetical protein
VTSVIDANVKAIAIRDSMISFLTYQLPSVRSWLTEAITGNGELGFDSEEGA